MTELTRGVLYQAVGRLKAANVPNAEVDARILLAEASGVERGRLILIMDQEIAVQTRRAFYEMVDRRIGREPVSQIVGRREFFGREFEVNCDVLDPRPETEALVELALSGKTPMTVLDLGVGSGAILLSLLSEWKDSSGLGVDVKESTLSVAKRNAVRLGVSDRVQFAVSNWFVNIEDSFDLIVSNPPYIAASDFDTLIPDVRDWEPKEALTPGRRGVEAYEVIAQRLDEFLNPNGRALFEIGIDQAGYVSEIFAERGFGLVTLCEDLSGRDRVISVSK